MNPLILGGLVEAAKKLIDHWFPDPTVAAEKKLELARLEQNGVLAQLAASTDLAKAQIGLNTEEVKSGSLLGKWRGALGWGLTGSLIYQLILHPFLVFGILIFQPAFPVDKLPKLDWKQLGGILMGMLGIGG
jgi:hypothetical protein